MIKKYTAYIVIALSVGIVIAFYFTGYKNVPAIITESPSGEPVISLSPSISPRGSISVSPTPLKTPRLIPTPTLSPTPSPTKTPGIVASPVPWDQLSPEASCELKGEIKYLLVNDGPTHNNVYDNQDAKFIYKGVDHPGRLIFWTISPQDDLGVGPQIFAQMPLPDGESLIGISLPENPKFKQYELTASITYGRLVDGNVKLFTKACIGKTTVVLP